MCNKLISVYITTHNRSDLLSRAILSVVNQTYSNLEIIISDDGSTDNTCEVVKQFMAKDNRIVYIKSDVPQGANSARNAALDIAKGEFITGLDDDDEFHKDRIFTFLCNWDEKFSFLCCNFLNVYSNNEKKLEYNEKDITIEKSDLLFYNYASNQIFTLTERMKKVRFDEGIKKLQDWECWLRMLDNYGSGYRIGQPTYNMYHDSNNRVSQSEQYSISYKILVRKNLNIYSKYLKLSFVEECILNDKRCSMSNLFKVRSYHQFKIFIKSYLGRF